LAKVKHLGFEGLSSKIAKEYQKKGMSPKKAEEIGNATAANIARNASPSAKKRNPSLKHVKGGSTMNSKVKCACKPMKAACKTKAAAKVKCACKTKAAAKVKCSIKGKK